MENKKTRVKFSVAAYAVLIVFVIFLAAVGVLIYKFDSNGKFARAVTGIVPYPAAVINGTDFITVSALRKNLGSVKSFYENQNFSDVGLRVDFTTPDGQKRLKIKEKNLLNKMIENDIIQRLAQKRGIKITPDLISQAVERKMDEYGSQDAVSKDLQNLYGWRLKDFEEKIVKPDMYKEELRKKAAESDEEMTDAKSKIALALQVLENKGSFADMAKKYSDGESAKSGGELGWLTADQMLPEIAVASALLNKGQRSDILRTQIGFHIIRIEDKKTENGVDMVKLSQIFVRSKNFSDWLFEQEKGFRVYIPLGDFYWDKETQSVQFTSQELRDFENNLMKNSPDDASVLF